MGQDYTSGRINTQDLFERAERTVRGPHPAPDGARESGPRSGSWAPTFDEVGWPACGEIDVMEYRGQEPSVVHGSLHGPGYSAGQAITRRFYLADSTFNADFHLFAVEWRGDSIEWWIDDEYFQTVTANDVPAMGVRPSVLHSSERRGRWRVRGCA